MITDEDIRNAWASIARTDAGRTAYLHLQKIRMAVAPTNDAGTLQRDSGKRSFAAELMGLMASDTEAIGGGRDAESEQRSADRPVVFASRQPTDGGRRRSFREYAAEHDPELRDRKPNTG